MKLLLLLVCLIAFSQPISNEQQLAFQNEVQMRARYNEMLAALQDFGQASDVFCTILNGNAQWPLKEGRLVEVKAETFIRAYRRMYESEGWLSIRKVAK